MPLQLRGGHVISFYTIGYVYEQLVPPQGQGVPFISSSSSCYLEHRWGCEPRLTMQLGQDPEDGNLMICRF